MVTEVKLPRFRFQQQLMPGVGAPSEAWRFLQGASPCQVRSSQPPVPRVASVEEVEDTERIRGSVHRERGRPEG